VRAALVIAVILVLGSWVGLRHLPGEAKAEPITANVRPQEIVSVSLDGRGLPTAALRAALETRAGTLIELATVQRDRESLRGVLVARGYLVAQVELPRVTFGPGGAVYVTFPISLGPQFRIRRITIEGATAVEAGVQTLGVGEVADARGIGLARRSLEERLLVRGKHTIVESRLLPDAPTGLVDVALAAH
jgi:hypothetical protein